jgi:hypothetical protein
MLTGHSRPRLVSGTGDVIRTSRFSRSRSRNRACFDTVSGASFCGVVLPIGVHPSGHGLLMHPDLSSHRSNRFI